LKKILLFFLIMIISAISCSAALAEESAVSDTSSGGAVVIPAKKDRAEKLPMAEIPDPCSMSDPEILLSLPDGPTVADSPCSVPAGHLLLELQYAHEDLRGEGGGTVDVYMQATEIRYGLPGKNEFKVLTPSYASEKTHSGLSATSVGFKHEVDYADKWTGALETILTLPSGNDAFGSKGLGAAFNAIVGYSLSDSVGLSLQLGVSTLTDPELAGGRRFTSFNPIFVTTWHPVKRLQFYGEIFGQTKTSRDEGAGFNFDGGVQYIIYRWLEADLAEGVRLTGNLGGYTHYFQAGVKFLF
jgi:Putative MetA-pathway of phenol degradation